MEFYPFGREISLVVRFVMQVGKVRKEVFLIYLKPFIAYVVEEASVIIQFILGSYTKAEVS